MTAVDCKICKMGEQELKELLVYQDEHWRLRHSSETDILGYFILEPRRHFLDLSESAVAEQVSFGVLSANAVAAIRRLTDCSRVYSFVLAEAVPHFHVHLIPRTAYLPRAFRGRGIMSYPTEKKADSNLVNQCCQSMRLLLKRTGLAEYLKGVCS